MKFILSFCILFISALAIAQTEDQIFVKKKLQLLVSIADRDMESIKMICKQEKGLVNKEDNGNVYSYLYKSEAQDYTVIVTFEFNQLYCKKMKVEIIPLSKDDTEIGRVVTNTLKRKFKIKKTSVTDKKVHTTIYFLSNGRYAGILSSYDDTKKMVLTISRKSD